MPEEDFHLSDQMRSQAHILALEGGRMSSGENLDAELSFDLMIGSPLWPKR